MARIKVLLTIVVCLIAGVGCANRLSDRADVAAGEESTLLQTNETHSDNGAVTIYTNPAAHPHSRINKNVQLTAFFGQTLAEPNNLKSYMKNTIKERVNRRPRTNFGIRC